MPLHLFLIVGLLLAPAAFAQTFTDASDLLPLDRGGSLSAAIADVDGDGYTDLISGDYLVLQRSGGGEVLLFEDISELALGSVYGDVDADGRLDVLVLDAFEPALFQYQPAREALAPHPGGGIDVGDGFSLTQGSILFDYDRDGVLDVLIGNDGGIDLLFRGLGEGGFEDASAALPQIERGDYGMMAADYDRDGDDDVYVGLCIGVTENILYRNDGAAFAEVAAAAGAADPRASWGVVWFDFDNDGWLDLFVANMTPGSGRNGLFRNEGDGTLTDIAGVAGVSGRVDEDSWNATAADFDNDGWVDLFVANRPGPSRLYRNNGDGTFTEITAAAALPDLGGIGVATGDVNSDGWLDLFFPDANFSGALYLNDGGSNGWLSVDLVGLESNPNGIGARIEVVAGDLSMVREITAGDGFMSQSHGVGAHFGLGAAASTDITIRWPSGQVDVLEGVTANQAITVVEGIGINASPAMFELTVPADGAVVPLGEPVILAWEPAADADAVGYTVHLAAPDGTEEAFETAEPTLEVPASALGAEGSYRWAVVARDAYSARTSLDNASFTNNPDVASEAPPEVHRLSVEVWPNPVQDVASVRFELGEPDAVQVEIIDALGRRVQRIALGARGAGSHVEALDMSGLQTGMYVVRVERARGESASAVITHVE